MPVGPHEQCRLSLGVALLDDCLYPGHSGGVAARPAQKPVRVNDLLDLPGELDTALGEYDDVVADSFQVGEDVGGEKHCQFLFGDRLEQGLQEVAAGERVE